MANPGVHLVGSVALPDADAVFRALAGGLGPWLKRIPDGETGPRQFWIRWQRDMLQRHPDLELDPTVPPLQFVQWDGKLVRSIPGLRFKPDVDPARSAVETGYALAAIESYATFRRLRDAGTIPAGLRFQVALPSPMGPGFLYMSPKAFHAFIPPYQAALLRALAEIVAAIPHRDLSVQWDICQEVLAFEDYFPWRPVEYKAEIFAEFHRLAAPLPEEVELGFHLCYGSPQDEHLVMPKDAGILTEMSNGLIRAMPRRLDFLHLPVPKQRGDEGYFAPLRDLALPPETTLYLGLIHHDDAAGDQARIAAARRFVPRFGIASECGWGRGDPARVPGLIAAHRAAARTLAF